MPVALPGTSEFDEAAIEQRKARLAARRPRQALLGTALILGSVVAAAVYAWDSVRPGAGALSLDSLGLLRTMPFSTPVVAVACAGVAIAGVRLAIPQDAPHLSRAWIGSALVIVILATAFLGALAFAPLKWSRAEHPVAAAERELEAKRLAPTPYCSPALDPAAFSEWVDDASVCGQSLPGNRQLIIKGPHSLEGSTRVPQRGLVYSPDREPRPWDTCVRRLDDVWWEYSSLIDGVSCPAGLELIPGG